MLKKFLGLALGLLIVLSLVPLNACGGEEVYHIGIAQLVTHPALDANRQGFIDALAEEDFVEGENVVYDYRNAENDGTLLNTIAQKFVQDKVDLILAIATSTAQACVQATKGTDIPVVFGSVTDPLFAGLIDSWENPGGNVTGISDWADVRQQVDLILEIVPDARRIGVLYNPGEPNSVIQVDDLKAVAGELGLTVVEGPVASTNEVLMAANSLVGRVDVIWVPTDNTVVASFGAAIRVCEENDIPIFAADVATVEGGAVAVAGIDYYRLGQECGQVAARILRGESPADIPAKKVDMTDLWVNPGAAQRMGISIPQSVMDRATKVIE